MYKNSARYSAKCAWVPSAALEYGFYFTILYGLVAPAWGLQIPLFGPALLLSLAGFCMFRLRSRVAHIVKPIAYQIGCAVSFILVEVGIHGDLEGARPFVTWLISLVLVQALLLRPRFMHRFAIAAFIIGSLLLPYLNFSGTEVVRAGLKAVGLSNANALGMWFGFCCVYFLVLGIEGRQGPLRIVSWCLSAASLFVVGLTVSRGPLLGVVMASVLACRRTLKKAFLPLFAVSFLAGIVLMSGLFDSIINYYLTRG